MMKIVFTCLLVLLCGCMRPQLEPKPVSLVEAQRRFAEQRWESVTCVGVPEKVSGFTITRYREGARVDLETGGKVYVIYEEYIQKTEGESFLNTGRLLKLDDTRSSMFRFDSPVSLAKQNYVDLVGFAKDRMFRIHAWQKPGATDNEVNVAIRVGDLAIQTIGASNRLPVTD